MWFTAALAPCSRKEERGINGVKEAANCRKFADQHESDPSKKYMILSKTSAREICLHHLPFPSLVSSRMETLKKDVMRSLRVLKPLEVEKLEEEGEEEEEFGEEEGFEEEEWEEEEW